VIRATSRSALRLQSDRRLIALARAGSEAAFEAIVARYRAPLLRYCHRVLSPNQAEDVIQQTFLNAYRALLRDDRDIELRPWLYRIAHNAALNVVARQPAATVELDDQLDGVAQPPEIAERHARIDALVTGIRDLPERQRLAIVRRELEGRSHEEIAHEIGATAPVVRQLIYRARTRLRDVCGLLMPLPVLRALLALNASGGMAAERTAEVAAGAGTGGALIKVGATVLATGAIATGIGGTAAVTSRDVPAPRAAHAATPTPAAPAAVAPAAGAAPTKAVHSEPGQSKPHDRQDRAARAHEDDEDRGDRGDEKSPDDERGERDADDVEEDKSRDREGESEEESHEPAVEEAEAGEHPPEQPEPAAPPESPEPEDEHSGA
jgi:RNA polymerase sigma factor (sigma-70 family)